MDMQEVFRGLSDPCPPVINKAVDGVVEKMDTCIAITFSGWNGVGTERILKYVAKKTLTETKVLDVLIWVMARKEKLSMQKFQMQVADRLKIQYPRNDEDDKQSVVDEVVSLKIHESLKKRNFLLVHDDAVFELGKVLLDELRDRHIIQVVEIVTESQYPAYLTALTKHEVLDLSHTLLREFPENFFQGLQSLRLLDLSNCLSLFSLPQSISCLLNLEHLLLSECQKLSAFPSSVQPLGKLKLLDLSRTAIKEIPDQFFMCMVKLVSLEKLNLKGCSSLKSVSPSLEHLPSSLEELDLSGCKSLQDVSSFRDRLPNLRALNLAGTPVNFISLRNHSRLETLVLDSNEDLDVLDLSGTPIQKFPLEGHSKFKGLSRLDLLGVKHLCKVNWERINRLPQEVNWDQCGDGSMSHMRTPLAEWRGNGNERGVFISVGYL
ncbi:hypothetical protein IFM89_025747 [Coptis chinensis]|uniref:NB-ARC domain-containing protein n=1 Tax=Coptis chinensis TaxID=261450 RepID=A0A835I6C6_9MAGN|nr:hypothetical protein IFM89_025747 [Coptis chinensis]